MTTTPATSSTRRPGTRPGFTWPDTHHTPAPADHAYASAGWLLGRHPTLARLVSRVPGVLVPDPYDPERAPHLDLDLLAQAVTDHDEHSAAFEDYAHRRTPPRDEDAYDRWAAAGPQPTDTAQALGCMSRTEVTRLRLLAAFAGTYGSRTRIAAYDLAGLDHAGQVLLADWCTALRAH